MSGDFRLCALAIDPRTRERMSPDCVAECDLAIRELLEENRFQVIGSPGGPYQLTLAIEEGRLMLNVFLTDGTPHGTAILSISPYRRIVGQYRRQCESFGMSSGGAMTPEQIEALDMGRRALHDDGARLLTERLDGKVAMDLPTARSLFTLICHCV